MTKQLISIFAAGTIIFLVSCEERGPLIDFTEKSGENTFVLPTPDTPQMRNVLIEEVTGVKCPNCPAGAKMLKDLDTTNGDRLVIIALHSHNLADPIVGTTHDSKYDFRVNALLDHYKFFANGEPSKPAAIINRTPDGADYFVVNRNKWPDMINTALQQASPVRLSMTSSYNPEMREDTIRVRVSYTSAVSKAQSLGIAIVEDHIIDPQYDGTAVVEHYEHEHVFRDYVTAFYGTSFLDTLATKEAGRVYERTFIYKVPERAFGDEKFRWNLDNCKLIAYVFNNENQAKDYQVSQAIEIPLK
jgi:hypothetical protein